MHALGLLIALATAPTTPPPTATVHKLRNVAAADVAQAVTAFVAQKKLAVTVVAEPVTNTVFVAGDAAGHKMVTGIVAALDAPPPIVAVTMVIARMPVGFAAELGMGEAKVWELSPRELTLLNAAIRRDKGVEIHARPVLSAASNQTALIHVGTTDLGVKVSVTPRIMPTGSMLLRVELALSEPALYGGVATATSQSTALITKGATMLVRGGKSKSADGVERELFVVLTPQQVETPTK